MLPGWTDEDLLEEALVHPRHAFLPLADLRVIERPGWLQIVTPSFTQGGFNEVSHAVLPAPIADMLIEQTIASYAAFGIKFRWVVGPDSRPLDLGARLERAGLADTLSYAMARTIDDDITAPADVAVEHVTEATVDLATELMASTWGLPADPLRVANRVMLATSTHRMYLARVAGDPAGVGCSVLFERSAYFMNGVVRPAHRRRGVYRALVAARLRDARDAGRALVTSHARWDTSAPLLEKLGFVRVCELHTYAK